MTELLVRPATSLAAGAPLAHDSDPIAIIGVFGPALLLVLLVVGAVIWDRRRGGARGAQRSAERERTGDAGRAGRPPTGRAIPPRAD